MFKNLLSVLEFEPKRFIVPIILFICVFNVSGFWVLLPIYFILCYLLRFCLFGNKKPSTFIPFLKHKMYENMITSILFFVVITLHTNNLLKLDFGVWYLYVIFVFYFLYALAIKLYVDKFEDKFDKLSKQFSLNYKNYTYKDFFDNDLSYDEFTNSEIKRIFEFNLTTNDLDYRGEILINDGVKLTDKEFITEFQKQLYLNMADIDLLYKTDISKIKLEVI